MSAPPSGFRPPACRSRRVSGLCDTSTLEPLEPLEPLSDRPLHVDVIKRTLPGLALVSGTFSGLRHVARPRGAAGHGENDLLFCVNVRGCSLAQQRDQELMLRDGDAFFATR